MDKFIESHYARDGSMKLADFIRAYNAQGLNLWRGEIVAELSRRGFQLVDVAGQTRIIGLSPRARNRSLRQFIDTSCVRADGLSCKLASLARASGLPRTVVIQQLQEFGIEVVRDGQYIVKGLGLKELEYA